MSFRQITFYKMLLLPSLMTLMLSIGFTRSPAIRGTQQPQQQIPATTQVDVGSLPDRAIHIHDLNVSQGRLPGQAQVAMTVSMTNTGQRGLTIQPDDFILMAEGDVFAQTTAPTPPDAFQRTLLPGTSTAARLTFQAPQALLPDAYLFYHAGRESTGTVASIPLSSAATGQNTIEDTFTRPEQTGRGSTGVSRSLEGINQATMTEYALNGGAGDPWGTAIDEQGNVWFAEPGCDFAPACPSTTPPGQLGEWVASNHQLVFYTLPDRTGNQPIFLALDGARNVWFTTPNNSMIGEFSPALQSFVGQWAVTAGSGPWDLTFNRGQIWYTEHFVSSIGRFNPETHRHTDYPTPSANSNPYGIAANDRANSHLIWFTENNSSVARIAALNTRNNTIAEYLIQAQANVSLTPHLLVLDAQGHPWWSEGFVRAIGTLNPEQATPGTCGATSGDCRGVHEYPLPPAPAACPGSHVSGITLQRDGRVWIDDSLSAQIGRFNPASHEYTMFALANCGAHPHDGLNLAGAAHLWWDEEFDNALGEMNL